METETLPKRKDKQPYRQRLIEGLYEMFEKERKTEIRLRIAAELRQLGVGIKRKVRNPVGRPKKLDTASAKAVVEVQAEIKMAEQLTQSDRILGIL